MRNIIYKYQFKRVFSSDRISEKQIRNALALLLGICFFTSASARPKEMTSKYNMEMFGTKIGEFSVTQNDENGILKIEAISDIKINLLFSYRVKYIQNTVYEQGVLKNSCVKTYKNGQMNSDIWLKLEKNFYLLVIDGDTTVIHNSITYSGSLLYFNEPLGIKQFYKERTAEIRQITQSGEHTYIVKDEKERELNRYIYENGVLEYASMHHALGTLVLKRIRGKYD